YPVEDLAQNVHRCVLSYNRDEVVARRRAAGLPVNLDIENRGEMTVQSTAPITISVESATENEKKLPASPTPENSPSEIPRAPKSVEEPKSKPQGTESKTVAWIHDALQQAMKVPEQFKQWSQPIHGLRLSQLSVPASDQSYSLAIVAVRNTTTSAL